MVTGGHLLLQVLLVSVVYIWLLVDWLILVVSYQLLAVTHTRPTALVEKRDASLESTP